MIDQNSQFFAILTNIGIAKQANADALGLPWKITQMGVGDANGNEPMPSATQTALINERRRAPLNQLKVDPANAAVIIAEQVIPEDVGGWWIREIGLYDTDGDLVAIANCAPSFKPLLTQGSGRTQVVRMNMIVSNSSNVELKIDPSVVLASRAYVDSEILAAVNKLDAKQSVRVATTGNIVLSGLQTLDGVLQVAGDRTLVKNQTAAKDNGIYIAASGAWGRAADADASTEVTPSLTVVVEQGTTQADTLWQMVTDGPVVLGTTALTFQNITFGFAPLASPAFTGTPLAPTAPDTSNSTQIATTAHVLARLVTAGLYTQSSGGPSGNNADTVGAAMVEARSTISTTTNAPMPQWTKILALPVDASNSVQLSLGVQADRAFYRRKSVGVYQPWLEFAFINSPAFTGAPTAPTAPAGTNTTQLATTGFVQQEIAADLATVAPLMDGAAAVGTGTKLAREDHRHPTDTSRAPLASPALTGTPTAPTAAPGTNTTQLANTAFVQSAVAALVASSPAALDTLNELAVALGNDPNFATTMTNALAGKQAALGYTPVQNGTGVGQLTTSLVKIGWSAASKVKVTVDSTDMGNMALESWVTNNYAPLLSPILSGTPTAPTPARFDATTKIATMAAVGAVGAQYNGVVTVNGAGLTGTLAHVGGAVHFYGASGNSYSLPNSVALSLPVGATVRIHNWGGSAMSVGAQGSDKMQEAPGIASSATARSIPADSYVDCIFIGAGSWLMFGTGVMGKTNLFSASIGTSGYQRLPSGLIIQWGGTAAAQAGDVVTTLPIGFPNAFLAVTITQGYTAGSGSIGYASGGATSLGAFTWKGSAVGNACMYIAIGY